MFKTSVGRRRHWLLALASCVLVGAAAANARAADESLKGETQRVDDLKVTPLKLSGKATLPCMLWADADGSAFLALEGDTGVLRRISFPGLKVVKKKDLEQKFTWMSLSAEGLVLSADSDQIWVVDPDTLEVKSKIDVPKVKRAVSAPGLSLAVACVRNRSLNEQKLYVVDLEKKTAELWEAPRDLVGKIGMDIPAMTPDGAYVFTQGDMVQVHMCRFSFKYGKLNYEEAQEQIGDVRYHMLDWTPDTTAGVTISPDSKLVCQVFPVGHSTKTPIYAVESFDKHHCVLDHGYENLYRPCRQLLHALAMGFDPKGGYIYTQNNAQEFMLCTYGGIKKKEYKLGFGVVKQFLVHPGGNQVVLLREGEYDAGGGRIVHSETVLVETPKKSEDDK